MPIYNQQKTKQKYYLMAFGLVLVVTFVVLWFGFLKDKFTFSLPASTITPVAFSTPLRVINIDFDFLESQAFREMEQFSEIPAFENEIGTDQPFVSPAKRGSSPYSSQPENTNPLENELKPVE